METFALLLGLFWVVVILLFIVAAAKEAKNPVVGVFVGVGLLIVWILLSDVFRWCISGFAPGFW